MVVVTVTDGKASGIADAGLTEHAGASVVAGVTTQGTAVNDTEPDVPCRLSVAMALPPGSTAAGLRGDEMVRVKLWACAEMIDAAGNMASTKQ